MDSYTVLKAKEVKALPKPIAEYVQGLTKRYRFRKVYYTTHEPGWSFITGEGVTYMLYSENTGKIERFSMQSEHSLHAGGGAISHMINKQTPPIPGGSYVVEFELFCGQPMCHVHNVTKPQI